MPSAPSAPGVRHRAGHRPTPTWTPGRFAAQVLPAGAPESADTREPWQHRAPWRRAAWRRAAWRQALWRLTAWRRSSWPGNVSVRATSAMVGRSAGSDGHHPQQQWGQWSGPRRRNHLPRRDPVQDGHRVRVQAERWCPLHRCVHSRAKGEHIRRKSGGPAARDLWRKVRRRSGNHPGRRQRDVTGGVRDAEVGELGGAVIGDQARCRA